MFNLTIDSKLRGCDVVAMRVEDVAPNGYPLARATVRQRKTGRPVRFELMEQTRQAVDDYLKATGKVPGEFLFTGRRRVGEAMTTRQYARLVAEWITGIGLDPHIFATHSLRRTKATLIYRRTGSLLRLATRKWKVRSDISELRSMMRSPSLSKSKSEVSGQSGHCSARLLAPLRAKSRHMQRSKTILRSPRRRGRGPWAGG